MTYNQTLEYLYERLPVFHQVGGAAYKPGLDNTIQLMNALDNPQNKYRTIHVAGTNGKGSVSHLLAAVLQSAGYKVGLYTSPHLVDFGERIRVNGQMIEQKYVIDFVSQNEKLFESIEPSFFEATMAMAFNYFAFCEVDVAVVEVGLGGRLDSTNIIQPVLSIITNISFDHIGFLGDTLQKIASEKAGIIKTNTPIVIGECLAETLTEFEKKANEVNAPISFAEESVIVLFKGFSAAKTLVEINDKYILKVGLSGNYQLKNIATAFESIEQLKKLNFAISDQNIASGFEHVIDITGLQGRWQELQKSPIVVCDTGHNEAGIRFVVDQLNEQKFETLRIVIGMVNDKDVSSVLALLPKNAKYYFTQANIPRALSAEKLMKLAKSYDLKGDVYYSVKEAVDTAINDSIKTDFVFVGGSNFVVGEALEFLRI
jgi:dihydrofolate synthase/folylpolyglutamate synthase